MKGRMSIGKPISPKTGNEAAKALSKSFPPARRDQYAPIAPTKGRHTNHCQ